MELTDIRTKKEQTPYKYENKDVEKMIGRAASVLTLDCSVLV